MLNSLFILSVQGSTIIEKHWRVVINRSVVEHFLDEVRKAGAPEDVLPIIKVPKYTLVNILRNGVFYLAILTAEVSPLLAIEFLHRLADTFQDYFNDITENGLKENFVTIYEVLRSMAAVKAPHMATGRSRWRIQLLEEMMDNGFPLTTEPNILKEMIQPPSMLNRVVSTVTGGSSGAAPAKLSQGSLSTIPWRKTGLKYSSNEIYLDIIESIDATIDTNGQPISTEVQGEVQCNCRLSGMPDLTLFFANGRILDDVSLHPCVRIARWERERVVSFIPADGHFKLMTYRVSVAPTTQMPLAIRPQINFVNSSGKIDITVRQQATGGKPVEGIRLTTKLPSNVLNVTITVNHGSYEFDVTTKTLKWDINRMPVQKLPALTGTIMLQPGTKADGNPVVDAEFKVNLFAVSGIKVNELQMIGESYKPFKGVRAITKAGKFQIRS